MSKPTERHPNEALQEDLDPDRREELERAMQETRTRLRARGVQTTGRETSEELVAILEAVERFELAVEARGGDLFVDEGPGGITREPDDVHFVLPLRALHEAVAVYLRRLDTVRKTVLDHPPIDR